MFFLELLGWTVKTDLLGCLPLASACLALGCVCDVSIFYRSISVGNKQSRVDDIISSLDKVLSDEVVPEEVLVSLASKCTLRVEL